MAFSSYEKDIFELDVHIYWGVEVLSKNEWRYDGGREHST